jgi:hypothetical protein
MFFFRNGGGGSSHNGKFHKKNVFVFFIETFPNCKSTGHNSRNKICPVNLDLSDMIEDAVEEEVDHSDDELQEVENIQTQAEEDLVDIDELLDSDEDLF